VSNIKSIALFVVVTMAAVGIWNFHTGFTCVRSKTKDSCVRKWFISTVCVLVLVLLTTLYYTTRETTNPIVANAENTMNTNTTNMSNMENANVTQDLT
jgi:protein-S-isoprenylcysteine O-methyltransferase Ste14